MTKLTSADYPIALSLDLEYWWCSELLRDEILEEKKDIILKASSLVLNLLDKYDTRATFFVLGSVAEKYPDLIKQLHHKGHEIAAHGYEHKNTFEQNQLEFEEQLRQTTEILTSITSERPIGYRAPNFSLDESSGWVYDVLKKLGYKYSSSIFPFKTKLYGLPKAPLQPYSPSPQDLLVHDPKGNFIEFPLTVLGLFGKKIPVSGGFYFRIFPIRFTNFALKKIIKKRPAIFYLHLRDVYKNIPRIKNISFTSYFFHYFGLKNAFKKLESLLQSFEFKTVKDVLRLG